MRKLHKLYALLFCYFWLPCPVCGKYFGGHELSSNNFLASLVSEDGTGHLVCPDPECIYEAGVLNILNRRQKYIRASTMNYQKCKQEKAQHVQMG